jgi:hypothetical protein
MITLHRMLHHIFSPVHHGPFTNPPPAQLSAGNTNEVRWVGKLCSPFGLLPIVSCDCECICPTVFGKLKVGNSQWIRRQLTFLEILQAFDIPSEVARRLGPLDVGIYAAAAFTRSTPSKILLPFAQEVERFLKGGQSPGQQVQSGTRRDTSFNELVGSGFVTECKHPVGAISPAVSGAGVVRILRVDQDESCNMSSLSALLSVGPSKKLDGRQHAAKDDDTDINQALWDVPFW